MAHNLYRNNMMYVGEKPWHGLGVELPSNATYDQVEQTVGFYTAEKRPVYAAGVRSVISGVKAIVRTDTEQVLSIVSDRYGIVQIKEVAKTVMEACGKEAVFHTAGMLGGDGARFWLLGEIPGEIMVKGDESPIRKFFLGTSSHDGKTPVELLNCATRTVCQNTLNIAMGENCLRWSIRHTMNAQQRLDDASSAFRNLVKGYEVFGQVANVMAETKFSDAQLKQTLDMVLPVPGDGEKHTRIENQRDEVRRLAQFGTGVGSSLRGTAWGALQGWTEYADHFRRPNQDRADKMESVWFGSSAKLKQEAFNAIIAVSGIQAGRSANA